VVRPAGRAADHLAVVATWIVDFYNVRRRHSACDRLSPIDYEHFMAEAQRAKPHNGVLHDSGGLTGALTRRCPRSR